MDFTLAMSLKELKKRTSKRYYKGIKFLSLESREVKWLSNKDLLVLLHLTRAAKLFDSIHLSQENALNADFEKFLEQEIAKGNEKAVLTQKLFLSQKSMFSPDTLGNQTILAKNVKKPMGLNYFPEDLEPDEFHEILKTMLDRKMDKQVAAILNQRSVVVRDGDLLKAVDFIDAYPEFKEIASELDQAREFSSNKSFSKYLSLQIDALLKADPKLDAKADKQWAKLDGKCKFEFTITRECYDEALSRSVLENDALYERLKAKGIEVHTKDNLGARVGIVNKRGTKLLKKLKGLVDIASKFMPYKNEYKNEIEENSIPQTAVDVDLILLAGDEGAYRASIVLAQNLPNDDKPSLKIGGGRRNVYHRQVRLSSNKKLYKNLIADEQFEYYNPDADHWAVICHENTHSLGPKPSTLGKYSSILEEYKADMGMYAFLDEFVKAGEFTENQAKQIMVTSLSKSFLKGKPTLAQAHKTRAVMICNRMLTEKAIEIISGTKLKFNFDKIQKVTKQMMAEVVRLQIDGNIKKAEEYINKWFVWTDEINAVAEKIKEHSKTLNGYLITPLADKFMSKEYEAELIKNIDK